VFDASSPSESPGSPPRRERTLTPRPARSFSDDTLEGLIDRSMDATLQAATDVKTLVEMLHLLLQRFRVQMLRLENEVAEARAERSNIQRQVEQQREDAETAAWEMRQQLEREATQARARLAEEMVALRAQAEEEARRVRVEAEREAAALLAAAQSRRTELLADLQPWRRELEGVRERLAREGTPLPPASTADTADVGLPAAPRAPAQAPAPTAPPAAQDRAAAPPMPPTQEHAAAATAPPVQEHAVPLPTAEPVAASPAADYAPAREPAAAAATPPMTPEPTPIRPFAAERAPAEPAAGPAGVANGTPPSAPPAAARAPEPVAEHAAAGTEVVFLRVPDTRRAIALEAAVLTIPGVSACRLREFERGRLVLDVEHELGAALADRVRGLADFDLRLTSARDGHLEFQVL
jgi:hypothetical protein